MCNIRNSGTSIQNCGCMHKLLEYLFLPKQLGQLPQLLQFPTAIGSFTCSPRCTWAPDMPFIVLILTRWGQAVQSAPQTLEKFSSRWYMRSGRPIRAQVVQDEPQLCETLSDECWGENLSSGHFCDATFCKVLLISSCPGLTVDTSHTLGQGVHRSFHMEVTRRLSSTFEKFTSGSVAAWFPSSE